MKKNYTTDNLHFHKELTFPSKQHFTVGTFTYWTASVVLVILHLPTNSRIAFLFNHSDILQAPVWYCTILHKIAGAVTTQLVVALAQGLLGGIWDCQHKWLKQLVADCPNHAAKRNFLLSKMPQQHMSPHKYICEQNLIVCGSSDYPNFFFCVLLKHTLNTIFWGFI